MSYCTDLLYGRGLTLCFPHNLGSSINSLGRRVTTFTTRDPAEIAKLRALLP